MADRPNVQTRVRMITIDENHAGQRLDNFLMSLLKGVPRSWVYRVLRKGEVRVNKGRCKPERRLQRGDIVRVPPVRESQNTSAAPSERLIKTIGKSIIYEDNALLIINKPSGIAVHGGSGLSHGVIEILRAARPDAPFLELAHRLDRETSGCLMLAKKRSALRRLQELQRDGVIDKRYTALLAGRSRKGKWRADMPLRKNTLKSGERVVRVDPEGKAAVTHFSVIQRFADATLVEARLETGRTHQIRVHAAAGGQPILGDPKYGDGAVVQNLSAPELRRLFLHASRLSFDWPERGHRFRIEAPLPEELSTILRRLEKRD